jgi:hypothetical protein
MLPTKIWEFKHKNHMERQRTSDANPLQKWVISRTNMQPKQNYTRKDEISKRTQMKNFGQYIQYIPLVVLPLGTIRIYKGQRLRQNGSNMHQGCGGARLMTGSPKLVVPMKPPEIPLFSLQAVML